MLERISAHAGSSVLRTGASAITVGVLLFASVFAGYLFSAENHGKVTNAPVQSLYIAGFVAGAAALIVALHGLPLLPAHATLGLTGRLPVSPAIGGRPLLLLFPSQAPLY